MKTNLFQKVMALICAAILLVSALPAGSAQADEKPGTPKISVKAVNGTDVEVTIKKTKGADGYEVWITSDCGYTGYKNKNYMFYYNYNENPGDYIYAATVEKDGTAVRTVTLKNLSKASVSVKVRAYAGTHYTDGSDYNYSDIYGEFSKAKTVKVTAQKKGYKSSYNFSKVKKGDTIKFGTYEQDYPVNGKDPIEWIVLDKNNDGIFITSKYALDCLPYNKEYMEVTWETCTLRKWLNRKFYNAAFNRTEKGMIKKMTICNKDNPYGIVGGNDTNDKVFLLSIEEVTKESFGFKTDDSAYDINRRCAPTKYAVAQGAYYWSGNIDNSVITVNKDLAGWWWLRSPGFFSEEAAAIVEVCGNVYYDEFFTEDHVGSVRPAMWIKLKSK